MTEEMPVADSESVDEEKKQRARSFLRERFLRFITHVVGSECSLVLHSNNSVTGIFKGCDIDFHDLLVEKLKTPFVEVPHSIVRSSDVLYIDFQIPQNPF